MRAIYLTLAFMIAQPSLAEDLADVAVLDDLRQKISNISTGSAPHDVRLAVGFPYSRNVEKANGQITETWKYPVGPATSATLVFESERLSSVKYDKDAFVFTRVKRGMSQKEMLRRMAIESIQIGQGPQVVEKIARPQRRLKRAERAQMMGFVAGLAVHDPDMNMTEADAAKAKQELTDRLHFWSYTVADVQTIVVFDGPSVAYIFETITPTEEQQALLRQKLF
jgi:hypothetical protein